MINVEIKNLHYKIPLYFYKQINNFLYYQPNQNKFHIVNSNLTNLQNKHLMINIMNNSQIPLKEIDTFIVKSLKVNNSNNVSNTINFKNYITFEFEEDLSYQNKIMNNDTIIFKNKNLLNFIKYNQNITKDKIKQFEDWLMNKEHMVFLINKKQIFVEIDDINLHWINSDIANLLSIK